MSLSLRVRLGDLARCESGTDRLFGAVDAGVACARR